MKRIPALSLMLLLVASCACAEIPDLPYKQFMIAGAVASEGGYPWKDGMTWGQVFELAGGLTDQTRAVEIRRVDGRIDTVTGDFLQNAALQSKPSGVLSGDVVSVLPMVFPPPRVTREFKDMPLVAALESILEGTSISYSIDPAVSKANLKLTAVLKNVSFDSALETIADAAGVALETDGEVVKIVMPVAAATSYRIRTDDTSPVAKTPGGAEPTVTKAITLAHARPGDVMPMLSRIPGVQAAEFNLANQIILKGTESAMEEAKATVRRLDTPDIYPKAIGVTLDIFISARGKDYRVTTQGVGAQGEDIPLKDRVNFSVADGSGYLSLQGVVTPDLVDSDVTERTAKNISVTGRGTIEFFVPTGPLKFNKEFEFGTCLSELNTVGHRDETGKDLGTVNVIDQPIAASTTLDVGGERISLSVHVRASVQKGHVVKGRDYRTGLGSSPYTRRVPVMPETKSAEQKAGEAK